MEEQNNNEYFNYGQSYDEYTAGDNYENANVIERFLMPGLSEMGEFNRENYLMDKGNAFNEYMFNKANEYNSAAEQMKRAENAGINRMLAAGGVMGGGNATATPMQSQAANIGANNNAQSPFAMASDIASTIKTGTDTATELGKMLGFGKTTKAELKIANETAKKIKGETNLNWQNERRLAHTFQDFVKEAKANRQNAEQNYKNLQKLYEKYEEERKLLIEQQGLVDEQENTQKEETKQKQYQNWESEFKKQFREMFGVQLNDSDASMLAQLLLNGHGQQVIDAIGNMIGSVFNGLEDTLNNDFNPFKPKEKEMTEEQVYNEYWNNPQRKKYYETIAEGNWVRMSKKEKQYYRNDKKRYIEVFTKNRVKAQIKKDNIKIKN